MNEITKMKLKYLHYFYFFFFYTEYRDESTECIIPLKKKKRNITTPSTTCVFSFVESKNTRFHLLNAPPCTSGHWCSHNVLQIRTGKFRI